MRAAVNFLTAASSRVTHSYASSPTPIKFRYNCFKQDDELHGGLQGRAREVQVYIYIYMCITHTHTHLHLYVCIHLYDNSNVCTFVDIHVYDTSNVYTFVYIHVHDNNDVHTSCIRCSTCETKSKARDGCGTFTILPLS